MEAITTPVRRLGNLDAEFIVKYMTWAGSEFQHEVANRSGSETPVAIVRDGNYRIVSWAATHEWRSLQTLEGFTLESHRRRGFARVAASMLVAGGFINPNLPLAVFAPHCIEIARSVGCRTVRLFERRGDDWFENS